MSVFPRTETSMAARACPTPLWSWRSVLAAGGITLLTFGGLPYLEMLSHPPEKLKVLTHMDTTRIPAPPPPLPAPPPSREERSSQRLPKPQLAQPPRILSLNAALNLDLALGSAGAGDFGLDFPRATGDWLKEIGNLTLELADLDEPPQPLAQMHPLYPPRAQARRIEGVVNLEFIVNPDGTTREVRVASAHPEGLFEKSATQAVRSWRFRAGRKDGRAVAVRVRQTIRFQLEE